MRVVWSSKIDEVLKGGYYLLNEIGVNNWALKKSEALDALEKLLELKVPILGGDVYENSEGIIQPNCDNWYCDQLIEESKDDYVARSIKKAMDYVELYNAKESGKIFFVLVPGT